MSSTRLKLLLIRGLGHSGTTMLDLALGVHPQIIGLGEATRILATPKPGDEHRGPSQLRGTFRFEKRCNCGAIAAECPMWGPYLEWLRLNDQMPMQEKVQRLLTGSLHAGEALWHVDAYQDDLEMTRLPETMFDIRIIHFVRDFAPGFIPGPRPVARQASAAWQRVSWRADGMSTPLLKELFATLYPMFRLEYEELALQPQRSLQLLCA